MTDLKIIEPLIVWLKAANADRHGILEIGPESKLAEMSALDSIQILELVLFIEEQFGAKIPLEDLVAENFESPSSITAMIVRAQA